MKYKTGDKVRIKSLDWYNRNKTENGIIRNNDDPWFVPPMAKYLGCEAIVHRKCEDSYQLIINGEFLYCYFCDYMLEDSTEESIKEPIEQVTEEPCEWCNTYLYYMEDGYTYPVENQKYCPVCGNKSNNY